MKKEELIKRAVNPKQYDLTDLNFPDIGSADSPFRVMVWDYIKALDIPFKGTSILDVGCGVGWLMKRMLDYEPSRVVGIEPASKNCKVAGAELPDAQVICSDLFSFQTEERFDFVFMILASDYFEDLVPMFKKLRSFLNDGGKLITIDPDYEYNKTERCNYSLVVEPMSGDEYVVSVTRPSGTMVGFVRKNDYLLDRAREAGLVSVETREIQPTLNFLEALPQYQGVRHLSIAQLNVFETK